MNNSYEIIFFAGAAQKNPATSNSTIKDIEVADSKWLPGARDRKVEDPCERRGSFFRSKLLNSIRKSLRIFYICWIIIDIDFFRFLWLHTLIAVIA